MKDSNTSERLKYILNNRNLKQFELLEKCKPYCKKYNVRLAKNDLSQYVSGKVEPKQDKLSILGLALDVSEAWLAGYDVPMKPDKKVRKQQLETHQITSLFQKLNDDDKKKVIDLITNIVDGYDRLQ